MNDFKKGMVYGFILCVIAYLGLNIASVTYGRYFSREGALENKAKIIYNTLKEKYPEDIDIDNMFEGIYTGMVYNVTDKYSRYISKEDYEAYKASTQGNYCGIGALTTYNKEVNMMEIKSIYQDSPSEKAGLKPRDFVTKINDMKVTANNYYEAIDLIHGEEGTKFNMTIYRPSEDRTLTLEITRAYIDVPTVATNVIESTGYMRITAFDEVTKKQFEEAVKKLRASNITGLIIDLRNNPGGLLDTVSDIADYFMPEGTITYTENKQGERKYVYSDKEHWEIPVVILTNENSASASELLTGALKDCGIAKIVGTNTYGKGVVQTTFPFKDGSALKITTAKYYTPKGVCIDKVGIAPDVKIEANEDFVLEAITNDVAEYNMEEDVQLKKAYEVLNS